jgi:hypothetical protein
MPKTLMQSVADQLQKERCAPCERIARRDGGPKGFREGLCGRQQIQTYCDPQETNYVGGGAQENRSGAEGAMGKG